MKIRSTAICLLIFTAIHFLPADEVKIDASVNTNKIYLGESVILRLSVNGSAKVLNPDLTSIKNCKIDFLGSQDESRYSIIRVNNQIKRESFVGRTYTYSLTPSDAGKLTAGSVSIKVDNKTISTKVPLIEVAGIESQDYVRITVDASRKSVLIDEPFDITISVLIKRLKSPFLKNDPLFPGAPPHLNIPFMTLTPMDGLENPNVKSILESRVAKDQKQPGFLINNYEHNPLSSFFSFNSARPQRKIKFSLQREDAKIDNKPYFKYIINLSYTPKKEGSFTFGPVVFKGDIVSEVKGNNAIGTRIFAVGASQTVLVVPPPEEGRPDSYVGAIGRNLTGKASLDTQTCNVGDPLKLTLSVSGNVNINNLHQPQLGLQADLIRNFKIYEDTVQTTSKKDSKEFIYTIRPITAGTMELPPINLSYYDTVDRAYKTVKTMAIPVKANETVEIKIEDIINTGSSTMLLKETSTQDIFVPAPISMNPKGYQNTSILPCKWHAALLIGAPVLYIIALAVQFSRRNTKTNKIKKKKRTALASALSILKDTEKSINNKKTNNAQATICTAIREYLSRRFNISAQGITPADILKLLKDNDISKDLSKQLHTVFERNFNSEYVDIEGAASEIIPKDCIETSDILKEIDSSIKQTDNLKKKSTSYMSIIILIALISAPLNLRGATMQEQRFIWNEANARISSAETQSEFLEAARTYKKLEDIGISNGHLFYNLGTSLLMAEQYEESLMYLLRAERLLGNNWDVKRNTLLASLQGKSEASSLPWYRIPLFWHYGLSISTRMNLAVLAITGFWLALMLNATGFQRTSKPLIIVILIMIILLTSSTAISLQQEFDAKHDNLSNIKYNESNTTK